MVRGGMALLAQARPRDLEHGFLHGAVRIVAVQAVLPHRSMLPKERPALLRMALVANIVDSGGSQQRLSVTAVRIMAGAARHLAFANWHM